MLKNKVKNRRVDFYTITHNPKFDSFPIGPDLIYEEKLKFVYEMNGKQITKIVPMSFIGPHLGRKKKLIWKDPDTLETVYHGEFFIIPVTLIYNY